jgi:hypothetical protein
MKELELTETPLTRIEEKRFDTSSGHTRHEGLQDFFAFLRRQTSLVII